MDHLENFNDQNSEALQGWLQGGNVVVGKSCPGHSQNPDATRGATDFEQDVAFNLGDMGYHPWGPIPHTGFELAAGQDQIGDLTGFPDLGEMWDLDLGFDFSAEMNPAPAPTATPPKPFNCTVTGCASTGFKRKYELEHHMKKHTRAVVFPCPVGSCAFSTQKKAFYRRDKLMSHLRNAHPGYQADTTGSPAAAASSSGQAIHAG